MEALQRSAVRFFARAEVTSESDIVRGEVMRLRVREVSLPSVRGTPVVARKGGQV